MAFNLDAVPGCNDRGKIMADLKNLGFEISKIKPREMMINYARRIVGRTIYKRRALMAEAPEYVDCSSFIKWLYGQIGIWIPRRSIAQYEFSEGNFRDYCQVGDLVFKKGRVNCHLYDEETEVGHVGLVTEVDTDGKRGLIIHAAEKGGVTEVPLRYFIERKSYRGARWVVRDWEAMVMLFIPPNLEIETSDDVKWHLLTNMT